MSTFTKRVETELIESAKAYNKADLDATFTFAISLASAFTMALRGGVSQNAFVSEAAVLFDRNGLAHKPATVANMLRFGLRLADSEDYSDVARRFWPLLGSTATMAAIACPAFSHVEAEAMLAAMKAAKAAGLFMASATSTYVKAAKAAKDAEAKAAKAEARPVRALTQAEAEAAIQTVAEAAGSKAAKAKAADKAEAEAEAEAEAKAERVRDARVNDLFKALGLGVTLDDLSSMDQAAYRQTLKAAREIRKAADGEAEAKAA